MTSKNRSSTRNGKLSSVAGDFSLELSRLLLGENIVDAMTGVVNSIGLGCCTVG
jgi:hypothetical protein